MIKELTESRLDWPTFQAKLRDLNRGLVAECGIHTRLHARPQLGPTL